MIVSQVCGPPPPPSGLKEGLVDNVERLDAACPSREGGALAGDRDHEGVKDAVSSHRLCQVVAEGGHIALHVVAELCLGWVEALLWRDAGRVLAN